MEKRILTVDLKEFDKQIKEVSKSVTNPPIEEGIGNLLTEIYFQLEEHGEVCLKKEVRKLWEH